MLRITHYQIVYFASAFLYLKWIRLEGLWSVWVCSAFHILKLYGSLANFKWKPLDMCQTELCNWKITISLINSVLTTQERLLIIKSSEFFVEPQFCWGNFFFCSNVRVSKIGNKSLSLPRQNAGYWAAKIDEFSANSVHWTYHIYLLIINLKSNKI